MSPEDLLDLWERGSDAPAPARGRLLAGWISGTDPGDVAGWPLGEVGVRVLDAWRALALPPFEAVVDCPSCADMLELVLDPRNLPTSPPALPRAVLDDDGHPIHPRLLTGDDLDAVAGLEPLSARRELVRRASGVADPPEPLQRSVAAALADADPAASWWVELTCPACRQVWEEPWDLAAFVWHAVDDAARQLMEEVAELAAAFGWSEPTVLALPARRRATYLQRAVS